MLGLSIADFEQIEFVDETGALFSLPELNVDPVAVDDSGVGFTTDEDTAVRTTSVLLNDSDADGGTLSIVSIDTAGTLGQVTDNGEGTFNYNPNGQFENLAAGESATDSFAYTLSDGQGGSSTAIVTIAIDGRDEPNIPPVAADDSGEGFATDEDTAFRTASVLTNDSDSNGGTLSIVSIDTTGTLGLVTDNGDGTFNYDPNGQFESLAAGESTTDSFTYTLSDGQGGFNTATVTIAIDGRDEPNIPPVAADDSGEGFATDEDTAFRTASVLTNDSDADGGTLSIVAIDTTGTLGQVTDNGDGTFNYDPNRQFESLAAGESATDSFTYTLSDGQGGSNTATVTIAIDGRDELNIPPDAADDSGEGFATDEDTAFRTASVLTNDSDSDGGTLSIVSIDTAGTLGLVTDNGDGTFNYDPNGQFESLAAGESATDSFTYTLSDGQGGFNTAAVTIAIDGRDEPNIPPVAADDSGEGFATDEDTAFRTASVLTNDSDTDGGTLSIVSIDTTGTLGLVTDNGDGTFNYNPNGQFESLAAGESATDSFIYTLSDGQGGSSTATVTIAIEGRDEPDLENPAIFAALSNDTGGSAQDNITSDPTVTGNTTDNIAVTGLFARLSTAATLDFVDISSALNPDGSFVLNREMLESIKGAPLVDGFQSLSIFSTDAANNQSETSRVDLILDTTAPVIKSGPAGVFTDAPDILKLTFNETIDPSSIFPEAITLLASQGNSIAILSVNSSGQSDLLIGLDRALSNGGYTLSVGSAVRDRAGNLLESGQAFDFSVNDLPGIESVSPASGEGGVNVKREITVRFEEPVDASTVTAETFQVSVAGRPVTGRLEVSQNGRQATLFPDEPLPGSTRGTITIDGNQILTRDGQPIDADGDNVAGGILQSRFDTINLTSVPGTAVEGFVLDSNRQDTNGNDIPIQGVRLIVEGRPDLFAVTDETGFFRLENLPGTDFFFELNTENAIAPDGFAYGGLVEPYRATPGVGTSLTGPNGEPFSIYLPLMPTDEGTAYVAGDAVQVSLGETAKQNLAEILPDADPAMFNLLSVTVPADVKLTHNDGTPANELIISVLDPGRLPGPTPPGVNFDYVFTLDAGDADHVDGFATITFPNLGGLAPGESRPVYSFDHDVGEWVITGQAVVSQDGSVLETTEGGVRTLGWRGLGTKPQVPYGEEPVSHPPILGDDAFEIYQEFAARHIDQAADIASILSSIGTLLSGVGAASGAATLTGEITAGGIAILKEETKGFIFSLSRPLKRIADSIRSNGVPDEEDVQAYLDLIGSDIGFRAPDDALQSLVDRARERIEDFERRKELTAEELSKEFRETVEEWAREALENGVARDLVEQQIQELVERISIRNQNLQLQLDDLEVLATSMRQLNETTDQIINYLRSIQITGVNLEDNASINTSNELFLENVVIFETEASRFAGTNETNSALDTMFSYFQESNAFVADLSLVASPSKEVFYSISLSETTVVRGTTKNGLIEENLPANSSFEAVFFDANTGFTTAGVIRTGSSITTLETPRLIVEKSEIDSDFDGLSDIAEWALGTFSNNADSDSDGISDSAEIEQGLNPLDGVGFPTGVIATLQLDGEAKDITVEGNIGGSGGQMAYVATGNAGLAIIDASQFNQPILLSQIDLPGNNTDVTVDTAHGLVFVAAGTTGLHIVDVSNPENPGLRDTISIAGNYTEVAIGGGMVIAGGSNLLFLNPATGDTITELGLSGDVVSIAVEGGLVAVSTTSNELHAVDISGSVPILRGSIDIPAVAFDNTPAGEVFLQSGIAYVSNGNVGVLTTGPRPDPLGGYATFDLSDPTVPTLISVPDTPEGIQATNLDTITNGSGLAVVAAGPRGLQIHGANDPSITYDLITEIDTSGSANAVALASGIAYVADGSGGLQVVNFLPFDAGGVAPIINIDTNGIDADPDTVGIQVEEGTAVSLSLNVQDDVQVRNVELLLDGVVVRNDVSAPFDFNFIAPPLADGLDTLSVQVRATDTGGNATLSNTLAFDITPETIPPELLFITPTNNSFVALGSGSGTVQLFFSESIDPASLSVADAIISPQSDPLNEILANDIVFLNDDKIAILSFPNLPLGEYVITLNLSNVTDRAGNPVGGDPIVQQFTIAENPAIELSAVAQNSNNNGFVINGVSASDQSGFSVSTAGDVNGDGLDDLIVGAPSDDPNSSFSGASFVVFGQTSGDAVELSAIEAGNGGFVINGVSFNDQSGASVSNAGDVNGDGLGDLIVGAVGDDPNGNDSGASFVVFGKTAGTAVELSAIEAGSGGFVINGVSVSDRSGWSVSNAGDVNGDGLDDLIVGAPYDSPNGFFSGASFVVFGQTAGAAVELSAIEAGSGGFVINGSASTRSGFSVSNAGDVNGDGLDDLIVGTPFSGASFVVFGQTTGSAVELSAVEAGSGGFVISGGANDRSGWSVSAAGDVNGDGLDDLIVGAPYDSPNGSFSGAGFVVFGQTTGGSVELSEIEAGNGGFVINGVSTNDRSGRSVSNAGDVNGDGLDDLIVGAFGDDPNGNESGASFVVYGQTTGDAVELSAIEDGSGGFVINGASTNDQSGRSVSNAGDVNGDGFADLIVGAIGDDPNGNDSGASFVIFGGQGSSATIGTGGIDTLTGDNSANQLVAGAGDDTLLGNGGADVLRGGAGNDVLAISDLTFASLDGGSDTDTLRFDTPLNLDLRTLADNRISGVEIVDLSADGGNSSLSLNITDLLHLSETQIASDTLVIHGTAGDVVNLDNSSNGQIGSWADDGTGTGVYEFTAAGIGVIGTVTIDIDVVVNIV